MTIVLLQGPLSRERGSVLGRCFRCTGLAFRAVPAWCCVSCAARRSNEDARAALAWLGELAREGGARPRRLWLGLLAGLVLGDIDGAAGHCGKSCTLWMRD